MPRPESFPAAQPAASLHHEQRAGSPPRTRQDVVDEHAAKCLRASREYEAARLILATLGRCCDPLG